MDGQDIQMDKQRIQGKQLSIGGIKLMFSNVGFGVKMPSGKKFRFLYPRFGQKAGSAGMRSMRDADELSQDFQYEDNYDPQLDDEYAYDDQPQSRFSALSQADWFVWVLLVVLPPLGIYLLWQRGYFDDFKIRAGISAASGIWFVVLLVMLFSSIFGQGTPPADTTLNQNQVQNNQQAPNDSGTDADDLLAGAGASANGDGSGAGSEGDPAQGAVASPTPAASPTPLPSPTPLSDTSDEGGDEDADDAEDADPTKTPNNTKAYYRADSTYYHKTKNCSGMVGADKKTVSEAKADGKKKCPYCWSGKSTPKSKSTKKPSTSKKPSSASTSSSTKVWLASGGKNYHTKSDCSGMKGARQETVKWAVNHNYKRCTVCDAPKYSTPKPKKTAKPKKSVKPTKTPSG